jgi:large repetitive protein
MRGRHVSTVPLRWSRKVAALAVVATLSGTAVVSLAVDQAHAEAPVPFTAVSLPTWQTNGIAWAVAQAQGLVFVGGSFTSIRPSGAALGTGEVTRSNFAVFDAATGNPTSCALDVTLPSAPTQATIRALAVSPDGQTLYVGGYFSNIAGVVQGHLAAINIANCSLVSTFRPAPNATVRAIAATSSTVYYGGALTAVSGQQRDHLAAAAAVGTATPGALLPWAPSVDKDDRALALKPDGSQVVVGGDFDLVNGAASHALAVVDAATASTVRSYPGLIEQKSVVKALAVDDTGFYTGNEGTGGGVFDGRIAVDWSTLDQRWRDGCLGATQTVVVYQTVLYSGSHAHNCDATGEWPDGARNHLLAESVNSPSKLGWFPDTNDGLGEMIGPRGMTVARSANDGPFMWVVGEFTTVNGVAQEGITRFGTGSPSAAPSFAVATVASTRVGEIRVSWRQALDRDNSLLTYKVYKDNGTTPVSTQTATSWFWNRKQMDYVDTNLLPGSTHTYRVTSEDPTTVQSTSWISGTAATTTSAYAERVKADGAIAHWRYDESSGVFFSDSSGNDNNITLSSVLTYQVTPGALVSDPSRAVTLPGGATNLYSENKFTQPLTFSEETWFRTTTATGGKLIGFANKQTLPSTSYDKHVYMTNAGKIAFGVYNGAYTVLTSPASYNDGAWHHLAATQGAAGMALYLDGVRVGTNTATTNQAGNGFWRIGGDTISVNWPGKPTATYFSGSLDETAIYPTALSASTVAEHYALGSGNTPAAQPDFYGRTVADDSPTLYWRVGEASGTTAADSSPGGTTGTFAAGVTLGTPGAIPGIPNTAVTLSGTTTGEVYQSAAQPAASTFSSEAWLKTTTTTGGQIIGFGSSQTGDSASHDRTVFMRNDGKLVFAPRGNLLLTSTAAYNDGAWHHVVATQTSAGTVLYVDGSSVATSVGTTATAYSGYWRVGGDTLAGISGAPTSKYLAGSIDEIAAYPVALTAAQVAAHNAAGRPGGTDVAPPTRPTPVTASTTAGDVTLSWPASLDDVGVTGYDVYRSATNGFVPSAATLLKATTSPSVVDTAVVIGTWYYRVIAKDAAGNQSLPSNQVSMYVSDVVPPSAPSGLQVTTTVSAASLGWTASTDNTAVTQYLVYRSTTSGFTPTSANLVATTTATSYLDSGLPRATYYYVVVAGDAASNVSSPSAQVTAVVSDTQPPTVPAGVAATVTGATVSVAWSPSTDDIAVARYDVYRSTTSGFTPGPGTLVGAVTSGTIRTETPGEGTFYYRVAAVDTSGNASAPSVEQPATVLPQPFTVTVTPTADTFANASAATTNYGTSASLISRGSPASITYLRFVLAPAPSGKTLTAATLNLRTTTDPNAGSADAHVLAQAVDSWTESTLTWNSRPALVPGTLGTVPGGTSANTVNAVSLDPAGMSSLVGTQATLALSSGGTDSLIVWSANSTVASYRPQLVLTYTPSDSTPPSPPTGVTATVSAASVGLSWTAATDNVAVGSYLVYRSASSGFTPSQANQLAVVSGTSYADATATAVPQYYKVIARDLQLNASAPSAEVVASLPDTVAPSAPVNLAASASGSTVGLDWTASSDNLAVAGYKVYRSATAGTTPGPSTLVGTSTSPTFSQTNPPGTFFYQVTAVDAAGNESGPSNEVSTSVVDSTPPTAPTDLSGTVSGSVSLTWTASSDDLGVTLYSVYRSTSSGFTPGPGTLIGSTANPSYVDSTPPSGALYYLVVAQDAAANTSPPSNQALVTVPDTSAPSAPSGLTATATGSTIDLTWTAASDNVAVTGYRVYRGSSTGVTPATGTLLGTSATPSFSTSGVAVGPGYYVVTAVDAAANEGPISNEETATVADTTPPSAPAALTATANGSSVSLTWTAATDNVGVTGYRVHRSTSSGFTATADNQIATTATPGYVDGSAPVGTVYYLVTAVDAAGNVGQQSNEAAVTVTPPDTTPPSAPTGLAGSATGSTMSLTWTASSDDVAVAGYRVYRSSTANFTPGPANLVGTSATTSYSDPGLAMGTYYYRVVAVDAAGNASTSSNEATTSVPDYTPPSAPPKVASAVAGAASTLTWAPASDNVAVTGYRVYRSTTSSFTPGAGNQVGTTSTTTFIQTALAAGTYYYLVAAADAAGNLSLPSAQVAATVVPGAITQTLTPSADAYVNAGAPATNFGTSSSLFARGTIAGASYLRFVVPAAPAGTTLQSAVLRISTTNDPTAGSLDDTVVRTAPDGGWTESALTWNNRPTPTGAAIATITGGSSSNLTYSYPVTLAAIQALVGTQGTLSVTGPGTDSLWFWSKDYATAALRPALILTYG